MEEEKLEQLDTAVRYVQQARSLEELALAAPDWDTPEGKARIEAAQYHRTAMVLTLADFLASTL